MIALAVAYQTANREPEKAPGQPVVIDAGKHDVRRVRFEDDKGWAELTRDGSAVWVRVSARDKTPERELRGNEASEKLLDSFAPLRASRALGAVEDKKL